MKRIIIHLTAAFMFLFPVISNAQALPFTAADYDAAVLAKGGASLTETSTVANAAYANPSAVITTYPSLINWASTGAQPV